MNLIFHSVKFKFHGVFTIAPILFDMLSEKVHGVKLKTVKIMKSRRGLTHVHSVKLCCYARITGKFRGLVLELKLW